MRTLGAILTAMVLPIALLNLLAGVIGGIWLAILGEWSAILLGFAIFFGGAFVVSLLLLPGIAVGGVAAMAFTKGKSISGWLLLLLASPWTYIVIVAWEVAIFRWFGSRTTDHNWIPMWLWSYAAATGVWSFLAKKEGQSEGGGTATTAAFAAQVAYIVLSVCRIWAGWPLREAVIAMAVPLMLTLLAGVLTAALTASASGRYV